MALQWRVAEPPDFPACAAFLRGRLAYDADFVERLPRVWRRLHREQAAITAVIEDWQATSRAPILAFGLSVFVGGRFMREAKAAREPYLSARVIRGELSGASPILRLSAIRRANVSEGLNVVILHYAEARGPLAPEVRRVLRYLMLEAFITAHRGYRLKEILQEFWDEIEPEWVAKGWGRVRGDYADWFRGRGLALPPAGKRPYLVGITHDEALAVPGSPMASLFVHAPPRFGFTPGEQRQLAVALHGQTDAELAHALGVGPSTVKARWRTIYDRVDQVASDLMPATADDPGSSSRRGPEKRRRVLEHLRQHPEELRPSLRRQR